MFYYVEMGVDDRDADRTSLAQARQKLALRLSHGGLTEDEGKFTATFYAPTFDLFL
jgi:hypothetical protein